MLTQEQAEAAFADNRKVVYWPQGRDSAQDEGYITRVTDRGAFVRYSGDSGAKLTSFEDLELMVRLTGDAVVDRPDSVTHSQCLSSAIEVPGELLTHHLVPVLVQGRGDNRATVLQCRWCLKPEAQLREELGL